MSERRFDGVETRGYPDPRDRDNPYETKAAEPRTTAGFAAEAPGMSLEQRFQHLFTYHAPRTFEQVKGYEAIRDAARHFATVVMKNTPAGADQADAVRKIREAVMTANAAIALEGIH